MPLSNRSSIIANQDVAAATFVVGNDLAVCDFQRLEDALVNLPVAGGSIALLNSITMPASGYTLPDKPVSIFGVGQSATIGTGGSTNAVFTISFDRSYSFQGFGITGTGIANESAFQVSAGGTSFVNQTSMYDIRVSNLEKVFLVGATDFPIFNTVGCVFNVANLATSFHWTGGGGEWHSSNTMCAAVSGTRGGIQGSFFDVPQLYWTNCSVFIQNGGTVGYSELSRCSIRHGTLFLTAQGTILSNCAFDSAPAVANFVDVGSDSTTVTDCSFTTSTSADVRVTGSGNIIAHNQGGSVDEVTGSQNYYAGNTSFTPAGVTGTESLVENYNVRSVSVDTLANAFTRTLLVDASGGNRMVTLPTASTSKFRKYTIKKTDATANTVTIDAAGAETIDGATTQVMNTQWQSMTIQSNGTAWSVLSTSGFGGASASVDPRDIYRYSMIHQVGG